MAGLEFSKAGILSIGKSTGLRSKTPITLSFISSTNAQNTNGSFTVPIQAQSGDLLVLYSLATSGGGGSITSVIPAGFTVINEYGGTATDSRTWKAINIFKVLEASDSGSTITVLAADRQYSILLRPSKLISSVVTIGNQQFSTNASAVSSTVSPGISGEETAFVASHAWSFSNVNAHLISNVSQNVFSTGSNFRTFRFGILNQITFPASIVASFTTSAGQYAAIDVGVILVD